MEAMFVPCQRHGELALAPATYPLAESLESLKSTASLARSPSGLHGSHRREVDLAVAENARLRAELAKSTSKLREALGHGSPQAGWQTPMSSLTRINSSPAGVSLLAAPSMLLPAPRANADPSSQASQKAAADALFEQLDRDKNGVITRGELRRGLEEAAERGSPSRPSDTGSVVASIIAAAAEPSPCGNTAAILAASEAAVKPRFDPTRGAGGKTAVTTADFGAPSQHMHHHHHCPSHEYPARETTHHVSRTHRPSVHATSVPPSHQVASAPHHIHPSASHCVVEPEHYMGHRSFDHHTMPSIPRDIASPMLPQEPMVQSHYHHQPAVPLGHVSSHHPSPREGQLRLESHSTRHIHPQVMEPLHHQVSAAHPSTHHATTHHYSSIAHPASPRTSSSAAPSHRSDDYAAAADDVMRLTDGHKKGYVTPQDLDLKLSGTRYERFSHWLTGPSVWAVYDPHHAGKLHTEQLTFALRDFCQNNGIDPIRMQHRSDAAPSHVSHAGSLGTTGSPYTHRSDQHYVSSPGTHIEYGGHTGLHAPSSSRSIQSATSHHSADGSDRITVSKVRGQEDAPPHTFNPQTSHTTEVIRGGHAAAHPGYGMLNSGRSSITSSSPRQIQDFLHAAFEPNGAPSARRSIGPIG